MLALGDDDPAVVLARLDEVHFVAAARAELGLPDLARHGMQREAQRIAIPDGVDLGLVSGLPDERIVRRNRAVVTNAQNLADVGGRILRQFAVVAVAAGHVEEAGSVEQQARAMAVAVGRTLSAAAFGRAVPAEPGVGDEDVLDVSQRGSAIPARSADGCGGVRGVLARRASRR